MSNDRKWASNDKDRLLVENFKKFVNEYDEDWGNEMDAQNHLNLAKAEMKDKLENHEDFDDSWMYDMLEWDDLGDATVDGSISLDAFREMVNNFIKTYFPS